MFTSNIDIDPIPRDLREMSALVERAYLAHVCVRLVIRSSPCPTFSQRERAKCRGKRPSTTTNVERLSGRVNNPESCCGLPLTSAVSLGLPASLLKNLGGSASDARRSLAGKLF
jgi:hypothetical protein